MSVEADADDASLQRPRAAALERVRNAQVLLTKTRNALWFFLVVGALLTLLSWGNLGLPWRVFAVVVVGLHGAAALTLLRFPRVWLPLIAGVQALVFVLFHVNGHTSVLIGMCALGTGMGCLAVRDALGDVRDDGVSSAMQNLMRGIEGSVPPSSARLRLERHESRSGGFALRIAGWSAAIVGGVVVAALLL